MCEIKTDKETHELWSTPAHLQAEMQRDMQTITASTRGLSCGLSWHWSAQSVFPQYIKQSRLYRQIKFGGDMTKITEWLRLLMVDNFNPFRQLMLPYSSIKIETCGNLWKYCAWKTSYMHTPKSHISVNRFFGHGGRGVKLFHALLTY